MVIEMKKKLLFLLFTIFFLMGNVKAADLTCYYKRQNTVLPADIIVEVNGDGTVSAKWAGDNTYANLNSKNIVYRNFLKNNDSTLSCTSKLYASIPGLPANTYDIYSQYDSSVFMYEKCDNNAFCFESVLDKSKSSSDVTINNGESSMTCEYDSAGFLPGSTYARILYSVVNGKPVFSQKGGETNYTLTATDDFAVASSCSAQGSLYISCNLGTSTCKVHSSKKRPYNQEIKLVSEEDETIKDGTQIDEDNENRDNYHDKTFNPKTLCEEAENCNISLAYFCTTPTVARTLKFLGLLFYIAKILVPGIIIVMGFVNLFNIMTSGKLEDAKKYGKAIVIRIFVGIGIFLLPGIINTIYDGAKAIIGGGGTGGFDNCVSCLLEPNSDECYIEEN